jgi:2-polyprenyl-6-methoxyphenol hydroxylase-like FAD-dependent oxidoreductase
MVDNKPTYAVIGGGIAGQTSGAALHKRNINVVIYEAAPHLARLEPELHSQPASFRP